MKKPLVYVLLFAVTLLAYGPALRAGFVWNDSDYVTRPELRPLAGLGRIWFQVGATEQYYPVLHSAFWIEHRLWEDSPLGYHLLNVLLHAAAACLLLRLLTRLAVPGATLAAFLFALHPVMVESAAWVSEQKNTLSLVFYLAAALCWCAFDEKRGRGAYVMGIGFFAFAVLSKSVTATLPAALLVMAWWKRGRIEWGRDTLPLLPWFALGAADGLFTAWVEHTFIGAHGAEFGLDFLQRVLLAGRVVWFYLGKLAWPANLIFIYPRWQVDASQAWQWLFPVALLAAGLGLWLMRRRTRAPLAAFLFFAGSLFPTMGFLNVYAFKFSFVADHWDYLPAIGIFALAGGGGAWVFARLPRAAALAASGAVLSALGLFTWSQCLGYRDMETFYRTIIGRNPESLLAQYNLAEFYQKEGRMADAVPPLEQALRFHPEATDALNNLGAVKIKLHAYDEAIATLEKAVRLVPGDPEFRQNLGIALASSGRIPEAAQQFEESVRLRPGNADTQLLLARALGILGRPAEAEAHRAEAERLTAAKASAP